MVQTLVALDAVIRIAGPDAPNSHLIIPDRDVPIFFRLQFAPFISKVRLLYLVQVDMGIRQTRCRRLAHLPFNPRPPQKARLPALLCSDAPTCMLTQSPGPKTELDGGFPPREW